MVITNGLELFTQLRTHKKFIVGGRKNFAKILVLLMWMQEQEYLHILQTVPVVPF
jgi:hypothetical protein